jgi:hypothetical protein
MSVRRPRREQESNSSGCSNCDLVAALAFYLGPILIGLGGGVHPQYAAPLQKQFYRPIFAMLWAVLALLPFILIRRRIPFLIYCAAFCLVGGWMLYDHVVPFRYVAPDFHGEIEDPGGSYTIRGSPSQGYDYWITRSLLPVLRVGCGWCFSSGHSFSVQSITTCMHEVTGTPNHARCSESCYRAVVAPCR